MPLQAPNLWSAAAVRHIPLLVNSVLFSLYALWFLRQRRCCRRVIAAPQQFASEFQYLDIALRGDLTLSFFSLRQRQGRRASRFPLYGAPFGPRMIQQKMSDSQSEHMVFFKKKHTHTGD